MPKVELAGGYQAFAHFQSDAFPVGWFVDLQANVNGWFGIVGEAGGAYGAVDDLGVNLSAHILSAGVRLNSRRSARAAPFAQVSIGSLYSRVSVDQARFDITTVQFDITTLQTDLMLQLGGGLNLNVNDSYSVRGSVAYLPVFAERETHHLVRLVAGLSVPFGRR